MAELTPLEERFVTHIRSFIKDSQDHRQALMRSRFIITSSNIDDWANGLNLPEQSIRTRIEDFIWSYPCFCYCERCKKPNSA